MRKSGYLNGVLTVIAILLLALALGGVGQDPGPAAGSALAAQPDDEPNLPGEGGLIGAGEQRKMMLTELRALRAKMDHLEAMLAKGISVKVTEMPEIKIPKE